MQRSILLFTILFAGFFTTHGQEQATDSFRSCQKQWKYKELDKEISGTIVFYDQPIVVCGVVSTASVALIRKGDGDTIRILTSCNTKKNFNASPLFSIHDKVSIVPSEVPTFRIDFMPVDSAGCQLKVAYFGTIKKVN